MKKLFTFAAALLASVSLMAEVESNPTSTTKDTDIAGTSYTFASTFNAGNGSTKVGAMPNSGVKVRTNKTAGSYTNALEFTVNEGYAITGLEIIGVTNSNGKAATVGSIYVDGAAWNGTFDGNLPAKNADAASDIVVSGVNAKESIILVFSNLNGTNQANLCWNVTYEEAAPSTDPVLKVDKESVTLAATAAIPNPSATVKFSGKNLTAGTYNLVVPNLAGLTVNPTAVTVGADGKLDAEVTIAYTSAVDVAAASTNISLTINEITRSVAVNYSATLAKNYINASVNIEQWVLDNGVKTNDFKAILAAANIEYNNIDELDSLNDDYSKTNRNYAFLGLKMKKSDAALRCWLQAGHSISVKFGNVGADFKVIANGVEQTLTAADYANTTVDGNKVLTMTNAPVDMYLEIVCNSTKTLVVKQIMLDESVAAVTLPAPSVYTVTCADAENGTVTLANGKKQGSFAPGATVELIVTPADGYVCNGLTWNGTALHDDVPGQAITFTMPAEAVAVEAVFATGFPTDINNTDAAVKAVKVIRNGQLIIVREGIEYNAQGAIVK